MAITDRTDINLFRESKKEWEGYLRKHKPFVVSKN
jgi:hypothetical protein